MSTPIKTAAATAPHADQPASQLPEARDAGHGAADCANCGTPLLGRYCHGCGQSAHLHHSLWHLLEEVLHGIFHFEDKAWRTLPELVLRPGQLTRDYVQGQRTRHVSPLALFLFLIFLMFLVFSLVTRTPEAPAGSAQAHAQTRARLAGQIEANKNELQRLENVKKTQPPGAEPDEDSKEELALTHAEQSRLVQKLAEFDHASSAQKDILMREMSQENALAHKLSKLQISGDSPFVLTLRHGLQNPELLFYKLKSKLSAYAFVLVPLTLPFLWLLFLRRRDITMYHHAVFALYSLSFMTLLLIVLSLLGFFGSAELAFYLFLCIPPLHMFAQLRGAYQLGAFAALWRTGMLLLMVTAAFIVYFLLVAMLALKQA